MKARCADIFPLSCPSKIKGEAVSKLLLVVISYSLPKQGGEGENCVSNSTGFHRQSASNLDYNPNWLNFKDTQAK